MNSINKTLAVISVLLSTSTLKANLISDLNWGLKNKGNPVSTYINPLQSYKLQARADEDIRLLPTFSGRKVKVAVVDTGIDVDHPDLSPLIIRQPEKCEALEKLKSCLEAQGDNNSQKCREEFLQAPPNQYPADCNGWSILDNGIEKTPNNIIGRPDFTDGAGHGTHVAGIITSVTKNVEIISVQVVGEGPNQPIKPFSLDLSPSEDQRNGYATEMLSERVSRGIIYAMAAGAEVINLSIGWPENQNTDIIKQAIAEAQRRGIIIVAAAGNDSTNAILRPCQYKGVICVAAHGPDGALASFSNYGYGVDIAAPGVEIISSIPLKNRSIRLPGVKGFDLMSGTSQAAPFVSGVVADMLSRGVEKNEIFPRLILGARKIKSELPILVGPAGGSQQAVDASTSYKKNILSGLLDYAGAMSVQKQALILPADKEVPVINWNRQSTDLNFQMSLKNYWSDLAGANIKLKIIPASFSKSEPQVVAVNPIDSLNNWKSGEEKKFNVQLRITDNKNPSLSRLNSELSFQAVVLVNGQIHREFELKAEVLVTVSAGIAGADVYQYQLNGEIPRGMKLTLVDEVLDTEKARRDYFMIGKDELKKDHFNIALVRNIKDKYEIEEIKNIKFDGDISLTRPQYKVRLDIDGDAKSDYLYGLIEYLDKEATIYGDYRNHFYIFDENMNLKKYIIFDDKRAALPYTFYWMKVNGKLRPAWIGKGQEVTKNFDVTDLWSTDGDADQAVNNYKSRTDINFYFLNEDFKLDQIKSLDPAEKIVDVIQTSPKLAEEGKVTVLIAKNQGTDLKPSYINHFSIAEIQDSKIVNQRKIALGEKGIEYRNLIDTFADRTMTLKSESSEYRGMMWYGLDTAQRQRITLLDVERMQITDKLISSQRKVHDSALLVKAGFQSDDKKGAFLITNSELEYHDLLTGKTVSKSLNRYSFFGDSNFVELNFPITLVDRQNPSKKLPALFTTEQSALARGIRILTPVYGSDGQVEQLVSPAKLRLASEKGCKPLESPVYMAEQFGYAMDYQCSKKIIRFMLRF
jgi:subtilisin family serine protease